MRLTCTKCQAKININNPAPGSKGKCPRCGQPVIVPDTAVTANAPATAQPMPLLSSEPADTPIERRKSPFFMILFLGGVGLLLVSAGLTIALLGDFESAVNEKERDKEAKAKVDQLPNSRNTDSSSSESDSAGKEAKSIRFVAEFMESRAVGTRFCIIADSSHSMKRGFKKFDKKKKKTVRGTALGFLQDELIKTLESLDPQAQFSVILFDAVARPMPGPDWLHGGEDVNKVKPWIRNIKTALKTKPLPAFQKAFKLNPRPDVIFFMTDGAFAANTWHEVAKLNATEPKVVINTIQFHADKNKKNKKAAGNLKQLVKKYNNKKAPADFQKVLKEVQKEYADEDTPDAATLYQEIQMRVIAQQSGGVFRKIAVEPK